MELRDVYKRQIASRFAEERQQTLDFLKSGIATRNSHFNRMIEQIEKVAIKRCV